MLLPGAVNYPCQPQRIKHRRRRPAQSLTRAGPPPPYQLQNKWLLVSPDTGLGLVWPPWHRDPPQHQAAPGAGGWIPPVKHQKDSRSWGWAGTSSSSSEQLVVPAGSAPAPREWLQRGVLVIVVMLLRQG